MTDATKAQTRRQDPAYRAKQKIWAANWYRANKDSPDRLARKAENERRRRSDPGHTVRIRARQQTRNAIRRGNLVKEPCACGNPDTQAHHEDYSRPLDVEWLCRDCHDARHTARGS